MDPRLSKKAQGTWRVGQDPGPTVALPGVQHKSPGGWDEGLVSLMARFPLPGSELQTSLREVLRVGPGEDWDLCGTSHKAKG